MSSPASCHLLDSDFLDFPVLCESNISLKPSKFMCFAKDPKEVLDPQASRIKGAACQRAGNSAHKIRLVSACSVLLDDQDLSSRA